MVDREDLELGEGAERGEVCDQVVVQRELLQLGTEGERLGREGGKEGGREGGRDGGREGGREGGVRGIHYVVWCCIKTHICTLN